MTEQEQVVVTIEAFKKLQKACSDGFDAVAEGLDNVNAPVLMELGKVLGAITVLQESVKHLHEDLQAHINPLQHAPPRLLKRDH